MKEVSIEAMERLAQIMNDSPTIKKLADTEFAITALKAGTQWLICEEVCKIERHENMSMGDVIKELANNIPSIIKIITLSILNEKESIFENERKKIYSEEFKAVYDTIMWKTEDMSELLELLVEVLKLINVDFFFKSTDLIKIFKDLTMKRKMTMQEASLLSQEQNGDK